MDIRINTQAQLNELRHKNAALEAENERLKANQDYVAMMTDVEIPEEASDEQV